MLATASDATTRATTPLPSITPFRTASARSSWRAASPGETTDTCSTDSRMRAATASGSSPSAQNAAAAVAIGRSVEPGTTARRRSSGSLSSSRLCAVGNAMKTKLSGPVSVGSRTPATRNVFPRMVSAPPVSSPKRRATWLPITTSSGP